MKAWTSKYLKKTFILIAYTAYVSSTVLTNHFQVDLTYYNYIFVGIIGLSLKLSDYSETIEKIIYTMNPDDIEHIKDRLNSIFELSQRGSETNRSNIVDIPEVTLEVPPNEPITPSSVLTHRDLVLRNGNIIRVHVK